MRKKCFAKQISQSFLHKQKGFAISVDALLATVLTLTVLTFVGFGMQSGEEGATASEISIRQVVDDAFTALDNSGTIAKYLADTELSQATLYNPGDPENPGIYKEVKGLLPEKVGLKIKISEYLPAEDTALDTCRQIKSFDDCFGNPFAEEEFPEGILPSKEIMHGRKIAVMKEIATKETTEGKECIPAEKLGLKESMEKTMKALFLGSEVATDIETWVEVTDQAGQPIDELSCDETAKVTIKTRNQTRDPVAIMLAMDKSESMETYDIVAQQSTGTFNEGTCQSEPSWVPGMFNNALEFDGVANYVDCGPDPSFNILNQLTISVWIKIDDSNENQWRNIVIKKNRYYEAEGYQLRYNPADNYLELYGGGSDYARAENVDLNTGWHHIAGVINGTTGTIYVDGVDKTTNSTLNSPLVSNDNFAMGKNTSYGMVFYGTMDELRLYDKALDASEIATLAGGDIPVTVSSNLFARWTFDETEGLIANDSSGNNRHCALRYWAVSEPESKWVAGQVDNALELDGYDDYVEILADPTLDVQDFTFLAWFKSEPADSWTNSPIIFMRGNNAGSDELFIGFYGWEDDTIYVIVDNQEYAFGEDADLLDQAWHHIAVTYDSSILTVYVDGVQYASPLPLNRTLDFGSSNAWIGTDADSFNGSFGNYWHGTIDEVMLYNIALAPEDIGQIYSTELGGAKSNVAVGSLVAFWGFDETGGSTATDSSVNGNNGTLYNWFEASSENCYYSTGQSEQISTNCPESKRYDILDYTSKQHLTDYDLGPIYPYINPTDTLYFIASHSTYTGVCSYNEGHYEPHMRLWVQKPDTTFHQGDHYYEVEYEDLQNVENGVYGIWAWSDAPINHFVYLYQQIQPPTVYGIPVSGGTYDDGETECENLGNWQLLDSYDFTNFNQIYQIRFRPSYYGYESNGGQCSSPQYQTRFVSSGAEWEDGQVGNALSFGGYHRRDYVEIPPDESLDVQNFTFSAWIRGPGKKGDGSDYWTSYNPLFFARENSSGGKELTIGTYYRYGDELYVVLDGSGYRFYGSVNLWEAEWHHVAVTYNSTNLTVFVDGQQYGDAVTITKNLDFEGSSAFIGSLSGKSSHEGQYWYGRIDEVRIYNDALSPNEINQIYLTEDGGIQSNVRPDLLAGYWALNDNAEDSSANGNNGIAILDFNYTTGWFGAGYDNYTGDIYPVNSGAVSGPYFSGGTWELWGWSDAPIEADARIYYAKQFWGIIYGDKSRSDVLSGGTCKGEACYRDAVPETTAYTNCPQVTGNEMPGLAGIDNWFVVDDFNVSTHLRGLNADVWFDYTNGADAICSGAAMGFKHPIDGSNDPNWYYTFPNKGQTKTQLFGINDSSINYRYEWSSSTPIPEGDYNILGWAEEDLDYTITWKLQRIDAAKNAAKAFINNAAWKESDEIGLLAFSSGTDVDPALTMDREAIKDVLESLEPNGETAIAKAIDESAKQLALAEEGATRFIILLTDGKANICMNGNPCTEAEAISQAIDAANYARDWYQTRIYVIGFADQSIIGDYEGYLKQIAKDKDEFSAECTDDESLCGKYYYAEDTEALEEMYALIAFEIARVMGSIDVKIPIPPGMELSSYGNGTCGIWDETLNDGAGGFMPGECIGICNDDTDTCVGSETQNLIYGNQEISSGLWWLAEFDAVLPCNAANCQQDYALFPPVNTEIIEKADERGNSWDGEEGKTKECEPGEHIKCHQRVKFNYADLNAAFTYGLLKPGPPQTVTIDFEIGNDGYMNIDLPVLLSQGLDVCFYKKEVNQANKLSIEWLLGGEAVLGEQSVTLNTIISNGCLELTIDSATNVSGTCSWKEGLCQPPDFEPTYWKIRVEDLELGNCPNGNCEGTIIAEINQSQSVRECPLHNQNKLICSGERLRFFTIDYYAWVK